MVDGEKSEPEKVDSGVPQGTVLGPMVTCLDIPNNCDAQPW